MHTITQPINSQDLNWTQRSRAPTFCCEAAKGLVMKGVCRNTRKVQRGDKRSKTHYCVQCDHTQGKTECTRRGGNAPKGEAAVWKGEIVSFAFFAQCPATTMATANTRCVAGVPRGQHHAQLPLHLYKRPLRGRRPASTPGPRGVPALPGCTPNIYDGARHTAGARPKCGRREQACGVGTEISPLYR